MRLYRLIAILLLIESRGQVKARELADALETSPRTIYRDVETLCQAGVPITATTGPNGGIRFMEGYSVGLYNLKDEDAVNLYLSGAGLLQDASGATLDLKNTLTRLEKNLPPEFARDIRAARERFFFDDTPWWGSRPAAPCLEEMRQALWGLRKLRITYQKERGGTSERTVRPYGLVLKNMQWYLAAHCERSGALRTFKGERIRSACLLEEAYEIPAGFRLEQYWQGSVSAFRDARRSQEQYAVQIRLHARNVGILDGLEVYESTQEGETITASVNMHKPEFAVGEALDIVWQAEILHPPELREEIGRRLAGMARLYKQHEP